MPHYAVHKLLAGLLAMHEAIGRAAAGALPLVLGMADYLWRRAAAARLARGTAAWREGLNYEVGALSETYAQLAALTSNASWLRAAALFDRACFTGPLALAGALHRREHRGGGGGGGGGDFGGIGQMAQPDLAARSRRAGREREWWQSTEEQAAAEGAMRGMHANANLAYILGAAARYELTGESRARDAALAFWRQLQGAYSYVTGGSSYQEEWRQPWAQPKDLEARGASSWPAHDHQESCVTHNTMLLSRRLAAWGGAPRAESGGLQAKGGEGGEGGESSAQPPRRSDGASGLLAHAEWYERALHNGVLGTQRGVQPGALLYMLPLGGGVSKAGGNHKWSNGESRAQLRSNPSHARRCPPTRLPLTLVCCGADFWCCMGSAIEAFTRLHHAVFLTRGDGVVERDGGGGDGSAAAGTDGGAGAAEGKGGAEEGGAEGEVEGEAELYILQLVPSELAWQARGCVVRLEADSPGDLPAGALLSVRLRLRAADGARRGAACRTRVFLRVPGWAVAAEAEVVRAGSAPVALPPPPPRSLLEVRLGAGNVLALRLRTAPALWPARSDGGGGNGGGGSVPSGGGDVLFALLYGPVLLAALSTGERRFFAPPSAAAPPSGGAAAATGWPAWLHPVPEAARRQLHTLQLDPGGVGGAAGGAERRRVLSHRGEGAPPQLEVEPAQPPTRAGRWLQRRQRSHVARRTAAAAHRGGGRGGVGRHGVDKASRVRGVRSAGLRAHGRRRRGGALAGGGRRRRHAAPPPHARAAAERRRGAALVGAASGWRRAALRSRERRGSRAVARGSRRRLRAAPAAPAAQRRRRRRAGGRGRVCAARAARNLPAPRLLGTLERDATARLPGDHRRLHEPWHLSDGAAQRVARRELLGAPVRTVTRHACAQMVYVKWPVIIYIYIYDGGLSYCKVRLYNEPEAILGA